MSDANDTRSAGAGKPNNPPTDVEMAGWFRALIDPATAIELRAPTFRPPRVKKPVPTVRRFRGDDLLGAAREAIRLSARAEAVYFVLNGVNPALMAVDHKGEGAKAEDIPRRRWLFVDCDPAKAAKGSATDAEKGAARALARDVRAGMKADGWPAPIVCDSGNGFHLLWRIDLPADDGGLVKQVLQALARRFVGDGADVDTSVHDAPRLAKFYGTKAGKGEDTAERPHRFARVLAIPAEVEMVTEERLRALVATHPAEVAAPMGPTATPPAKRHRADPAHDNRGTPESRAARYLERCEPAIDGQGGSNKAFKAACKIGPGFDLPIETAIRLFRDVYNPNCQPPWSEEEIRHKFEGAYKNETRRGWLLEADRNPPPAGGSRPPRKPPGPTPSAEVEPESPPSAPIRPEILITPDEHLVIRAAVAALAVEPTLYQRNNSLVTVQRDAQSKESDATRRPAGTPRIVPIAPGPLREMMAERGRWVEEKVDRQGEIFTRQAYIPGWAVVGIAQRGHWPGIRHLDTVVESPILRIDGSILDKPGYDIRTTLLYEPNADFPPIPHRPTADHARRAAEELLYLVADFPFAQVEDASGQLDGGASHRAAWLAGLLTPLARFAIDGPCPLFSFDASGPATGKSKLTDIVAIIATGRGMARTSYPDSDDEMRKRITSIALAGDRLMLIDNIASKFGGASIDAALTGSTWKDRRLGLNEMTPEMPLHVVWFATGNNLTFRGDILRRIVPCRLVSLEERPEERTDFRIKGELIDHVREERPRLLVAAMTLLRAHALADYPDGGLPPLGSYTAWSRVVRSAVVWATGADPLRTQSGLWATDPEALLREALIEGWSQLPGASTGLPVSEALRLIQADPDRTAKLRDALMEWSNNPEKLPPPRVVGNRLKHLKDRVVKGRCFRSATSHGMQLWRIHEVSN